MTVKEKLADGVLVVNLDERRDRWDAFLRDVAPQLAPVSATRLPAVKGVTLEGYGKAPWFHGRKRDKTWAGRAGCTLSHRAAIEHAAAAGWRHVLILEDDVELAPGFADAQAGLIRTLSREPWDICYLGFTDPVGPFRRIAELDPGHALYRIYGCHTTHAYLVNESAYPFLLHELPTQKNIWHWLSRHRAVDRWYARRLSVKLRVFAVSPSILNQLAGISDITGRDFEAAHNTSVPAGDAGAAHALQMQLRRIFFSASAIYDEVRGFSRRVTGF